MKARLLIGLVCLLAMYMVKGQIPEINHCLMPAANFVNEEFCFTLELEETLNVGFGPYLRIILPPGVTLNQAVFTGSSTLTYVGIDTGNGLKDPHLNSGTATDTLLVNTGYSLYILDYPVGSVTQGGVSLTTAICLQMDPNIVTIGVPLDIQFQGGYIYGNTPTGSNGPTLGPLWVGQVVPVLYVYSKTSAPLPRHDRTPGPDWPLLYSLTVDIANAQTVTGLVFQDLLPDSLMFISGSIQAPIGCLIDSSGLVPGVPGGSFSVSCPSGLGTLGSNDVQIRYAGYAINVLDESIGGGSCDKYKIVNNSNLTTNQGPLIACADTVMIFNMTMQQDASPDQVVPGSIVTNSIKIQISDYITAMDSFLLRIGIEDGLDFIGNSTLDGVPVAPLSIQNNFPSTGYTLVTYDLAALRGGLIQPGDSLVLLYETQVRQNYQATNQQVLGRDELSNTASAHYHLVDELPGTQGCDYNYLATVAVIPNSITKDVIGSTTYVPGEYVTYRLTMVLPSGDANNIIFTDFFPIPVHDVTSIILEWDSTDIFPGPNHPVGVAPDSIRILPANNALVIYFGNVQSNVSPESLEVYVRVPVTTIPFANGLTHSNFLQVESDNTIQATTADLQLTQITIGAPMLSIAKGVASVQNPDAWLTASGSNPVVSDGINVDGSDTVTFVSTITNIGGANAYNIRVVDPLPMDFTGCQLISVTNGAGNPITYSGNLFGPTDTLQIDSMAASGADSVALIAYTCQIAPDAAPYETIINTVSLSWASSMSQDSLFDVIKDSAFVRLQTPQIAKTILGISPGHAHQPGKVHVGEVIDYMVEITVPEGQVDSLVLRDQMGRGLAFAGLDSIVPSSADLSCNLGPINGIVVGVDSVGVGMVNHDRSLVFDFDQILNQNTDNAIDETIKVYYKARVLNCATNLRDTLLHNDIKLSWKMPNTGQTQNIYETSPALKIVEPTLQLTKDFLQTNLNPGDSVFVTLTLAHTPVSNATAYDVLVTDTLPLGLNFVAGSFSGACPVAFSVVPGYNTGIVSAAWDSIEVGTSCQIRFKVAVDNSYPSCTSLLNHGNLFWESVYDPLQPGLATCPNNAYGVERTGFANAPGQLNNYTSESIDSVMVGVAFASLPQITSNAPVCIGNQLELQCTPYPGSNVTYVWTTPQGIDTTTVPQLIIFPTTNVDSGYYGVTINVAGCSSASSALYLAAVNPLPVVLATGDAVLCAGQDRQLSAVVFPAGNYSYLWTGPNGFVSNQQNPLLTQVTAQMAGNYSVQVSANGCTSTWSAPVNIQVLARPVVATVNDTLACSHGLVDLVLNAIPVSGVGPFTFYWTGPGGFASTMEDAIIPNAMAANQGNYIVTMTDSLGCNSLPITAVVDITDAPQTPVITQQGAFCPGDALTLVTTPYAGGVVTYYWSTPNGPDTTTVPSLNIGSLSTTDAGLYSVIAVIDGCPTLMSALSTVVVNAAPAYPNPVATYGNPSNCAGDTLWVSAQGDSTHTYLWTGPNGFTGNGQLVMVPNADPSYNGSYEVTVTNGNCTVVASVTINQILPYPATPSLVQPMVACQGENIIIQANAYSGNVVGYIWSTPAGIVNTSTPSLPLQPVTLADSGNYAMTVNVDGCPSLMSGTVQLIVNSAPAMPLILSNHQTLCEGDTLVYSTPIIPGATYQWSGPAGMNSTQQNPPAIAGVTSLQNGVVELYVVVNGCRSAVARDTIVVHARPATPTLFAAQTTLCFGDPIALSTNGSCNNHLWISPMGLSAATLSSNSQNTSGPTTLITATDSAYLAGNWTAICMSADGCMSAPSNPVAVTILPKPASPSVTQPGPQCEGNTLQLVASSNVVNATFTWVGPNAWTYQGANPIVYNLSLAQAGAYGAIVWDNGCPSDTTWTVVTVDTMPATPQPGFAGPVCAGGNLGLTANATATAYLWTGPYGFTSTAQNPIISNVSANQSGYYQLILVQDACSSDVGIVNVNVVDNQVAPTLTATGPICEGSPLSLTTTSASGSNVSYVWTCPGSMIDTTLVPNLVDPNASLADSGWYSVCVMVEGCPSPNSALVLVEVMDAPAMPSIASNGPVCAGGNIVLSTTTQADTYAWSGPNGYVSTQPQPSVITNAQAYHAGVYSLHVSANGCESDDASVTVVVNTAGAAPGLYSNSPVCLGDTVRIVATPGADSYVWTFPDGSTHTTTTSDLMIAPAMVSHNGNFTVQAMYAGCGTEVSLPIAVTVGDAAGETAYAGPDRNLCGNGNTDTLTAGNIGAAGLWSTSSNALIISPNNYQTLVTNLQPGGDYVFTWTLSAAGCRGTSSDSMHIRVGAKPEANDNAYVLTGYAELEQAPILDNDSLMHQPVTLTIFKESKHGIASINPDQTMDYLPELAYAGNDSLQYEICLEHCPEMCDRAWVSIKIDHEVKIPDLITPNGDGINDAFEIIGLEYYPHHKLLIFNRWGNEIFATEDYQNDWKGTYRGQPVPDGTYFWVLEGAEDGHEILRGYITVHQ